MSENKLKPCPFCGGEAFTFHIPENNEYETKLHEWIWRTPGRWLVGCDTQLCMLNINNMPETFASEQEAAEAWNKRAEPDRNVAHGYWIGLDSDAEIYDDIKCSVCGKSFTVDAYRWCDIGFTESDLNYCPNCGAKMDEVSE